MKTKTTKLFLLLAFISLNLDSIAQWTAINNGLTNLYTQAVATNSTKTFVGTFGGLFSSTNNGASWTKATTYAPSLIVNSMAINGTTIFAGTFDNGVMRSTDNGITWTSSSTGLDTVSSGVRAMAINGTTVFAGTYSKVYQSTNNGTSWIQASGIPPATINALDVKGTTVIAGTNKGVYISSNNGSSFSAINTGLAANINIQAIALSGTNIFAGSWGITTGIYGVFLSTNNGNSWTPVNTGLPANANIITFTLSGTSIFAGTDQGVFISNNNGSTWTNVNTGLGSSTVFSFAINGSTIFAGTNNGGGVFKRALSQMVGINELNNDNANLHLYPNPSNGIFSVESEKGKIEIFNSIGEIIYQTQKNSNDNLSIDLSNQSTGTYFMMYSDGDKIARKKVVIQK